MSTFLDLIESVPVAEASEQRLWGSEGTRVTRFRDRPGYDRLFAEGLSLIERVLEGSRIAALRMSEAMSTSDFPLVLGDILDRTIVGQFREYPNPLMPIVAYSRARDFRAAKVFAVDGGGQLLGEVKERAPYPERATTDAADEISVRKFGAAMDFSWETFVNDDLDAFRDSPDRLARAARRTEHRAITALYVGTAGPSATLFKANHTTNGGGSNVITGNPVLSQTALKNALTLMRNQRDSDGQPIWFETVYLVVPPALELAANEIVNTQRFEVQEGATGAGQVRRTITGNGLGGTIRVIVDPYIPLVASSNRDTSWFLFGDPSDSRPALGFRRLVGHEAPSLWVKTPNAQAVGGGQVGPTMGDFEHDTIRYRVRDVHGGTVMVNTGGWRTAFASNGSGVA